MYTITEQEALDIFNNPPKKKTVLRELGEDEEGNEVLIKTGFWSLRDRWIIQCLDGETDC